WMVRAAIAALARGMEWPRPRPVLLALVAALTLSFAVYEPAGRDTRWFFSLPLMPTLQQQARLLVRVLVPSHGEAVLGPGPAFGDPSYGVQGLHTAQGQADVVLMFAESYGAMTFDSPAVAAALAEPRAAFAQAVAASGRGVVTARVRSPTFGGGSWRAHASLLSGLPMSDPGHHELLLASERPTLVSHFARHGYRTVAWLPGIKRPWPEGTFYGYDRIADDAGIGYAGPGFGYWRIPDQAAMALLHAQELNRDHPPDSRAPRFVVFATTSTHAPFHPLPPLVHDWTRLEGAHAYSAAQTATALATPWAVQQPLPNYLEALRYQFSWLSSYLQHRAPRPLVLVVVGDHQPPPLTAGPSTSWDVPVHVISDDPGLLLRLQAQGFIRGLEPPGATLGPMHDLTTVLLRVFSIPGDAPRAIPALAHHRGQSEER
ncbi:MAG TPA: sulfatase-like hydrolase/transferase, partial [Burkholderiaceae bacterium]